jgi:ABC-type multidrug transport system ATPase subunit
MMAQDTQDDVILVRHLTKKYGHTVALDDVSLRIGRNEGVLIAGPNGSGKSTLLKALCGILRPSKVDGLSVFGHDPWRHRHLIFGRMAVAFEDHAFPDFMSGLDFLTLLAKLRGVDTKGQMIALAERFDLIPFWDRPMRGYSSGMRRKMALAQALLGDPELVLLDEPLVAIDKETRQRLVERLEDLRRRGVTIVISSHLLFGLEKVASRFVVMINGRIAFDSPLEPQPGWLDATYGRIVGES